MRLLEREAALASLGEYAADARVGRGRLVLVSGEAGAGKTALLEHAEEDLADATWLWGACDGLYTPRPLGPLFDIATELGGDLLAACTSGASREAMFSALLRQIDDPSRHLVVAIEDVHWADEATLDLLLFLARRVRTMHTLVLVTYRDDVLGPEHPLRVVLGEVAAQRAVRRVNLPRLSLAAVSALASSCAISADEIHHLTGGNPFFVSQLVEADDIDTTLPLSVRDAVLARVGRLEPGVRDALEHAALIGTTVDPRLLDRLVPGSVAKIESCASVGLMSLEGTGLRFRHELSRITIAESIPIHRRERIHQDVLANLRGHGIDDAARLAYHAEGGGDVAAVLEFAPLAARAASELGAHREAFAQFQRALRFADDADASTRATLHDALGYEASLIDQWHVAADSRESALALWREIGDPIREGDCLRHLSRAMWRLCRGADSLATGEQAMAVLEPVPPCPEKAWAVAHLALLHMGEETPTLSMEYAQKAADLAEQLCLADVLSEALNTRACCAMSLGLPWENDLRRSLAIAVENGLPAQAGRAYANLYATLTELHMNDGVESFYDEAIVYCDENDIATYGLCLRGQRTWHLQNAGKWNEAVDLAQHLLGQIQSAVINRLNPQINLAKILARRGGGNARALLDEAVALADDTEEPGWIHMARLARAEWHWLNDDDAAAAADVLAVIDVTADSSEPWMCGETDSWARRLGLPTHFGEAVAAPFLLQTRGDVHASADAWMRLGCPYQAALTLADSPEEADLVDALAGFDELGATASARKLRKIMRDIGVRSIPTGPRAATRDNAFRLTTREQEILALLCAGLTNVEISAELVISERTVDHHVSAVLRKMAVPNRAEARAAAERLGLVERAAT